MTINEDRDWIQQLLDGDEQAAVAFWNRFGNGLFQVAQARISSRLRQRVGPDDVVQSVCRTFFRRAKGGQFTLEDSESLWRLLCAITLTKIRQHARFHSRQKRGVDREQPLSDGSGKVQDQLARYEISEAEEAVMFVDQLEQLLAGLDAEEQHVVDLKLQSFTNQEVAEQLGCSERTVRRLMKRVQSRMQQILNESHDHE